MTKKERQTKEKRSWREALLGRLDLPPDLLPGAGLIEIRGREAVNVTGGGKILVYTPEEIRIALHRGSVAILGKRLICTSYRTGTVGIEGHIGGVLFEED